MRQTLNASGTVLSSINYDPWGVVESGTTPGFGFTGERQDSVGMVYLRARWYNPSSGTFTARDPFAGFAERPYSLHPYQYAFSNSVRYSDPSGRFCFDIGDTGYDFGDTCNGESIVDEIAREVGTRTATFVVDNYYMNWFVVDIFAAKIKDIAKWHTDHARMTGINLRGFDEQVIATMMAVRVAIEYNQLEMKYKGSVESLVHKATGNTSGSTGLANIRVFQARNTIKNCDYDFYNSFYQDALRTYSDDEVYESLQNPNNTFDLLAAWIIQTIQDVGSVRVPSVFMVANNLQSISKNLSNMKSALDRPGRGAESSGGGHGIRVVRGFREAARRLGLRETLPTGLYFYYPYPQTGDDVQIRDRTIRMSEEDYKNWLEPQLWKIPSSG